MLPFPGKTLFALLSSFIVFIIFILSYEKNSSLSFWLLFLLYYNHWLIETIASSSVREITAETTAHYVPTLRLNSVIGCVLVTWSTHITGMNPMPHSSLSGEVPEDLVPWLYFPSDICSQSGSMGLHPALSHVIRTIPSWGLVLYPLVLKFLRPLPTDFYLISEVGWDNGVCISDWSLTHTLFPFLGWVLGLTPSYLLSAPWCLGPWLASSSCS